MRKKEENRKRELPDILVYRKKKYVIPACLLMILGLALLAVAMTVGIAWRVSGDSLEEILAEMGSFQLSDVLIVFPATAVLWVPALVYYAVLHIGERHFLHDYEKMPELAKQRLYEKKSRGWYQGGAELYEAEGYMLFRDKYLLCTPQIVNLKEIVWVYLGHSDIQISDMQHNIVSPDYRFFSVVFYTKDGRKHGIFTLFAYRKTAVWFAEHCPGALFGYGKEQKRQARELFIKAAEREALFEGEKKDSYTKRRKRAVILRIAAAGLTAALLTGGVALRNYVSSDTYLYQKNMKEAEGLFEEGQWFQAYSSYYAAYQLDMGEEKNEEARKGMLLSLIETAKTDGYLDSIIRDYENLFSVQELFTDETDISPLYFECTEYYLRYNDPMGAIDLLERGMETFSDEETVVADVVEAEEKTEADREKEEQRRADILERMREKKEDILAHCEVEKVTVYQKGKRIERIEYDENGRESVRIIDSRQAYQWEYDTHDGEVISRGVGGVTGYWWEYSTYDSEGRLTRKEIYHEKEGEKEKERERFLEYDGEGNTVHVLEYNRDGEIAYEMKQEYDKDGKPVYYACWYSGVLTEERNYTSLPDNRQIAFVFTLDSPGGEPEYYYYKEIKYDDNGNMIELSYYPDSFTIEEIAAGDGEGSWSRYFYTYDSRGNCTSSSWMGEESGEKQRIYEREYDARGNLIKETYYYHDVGETGSSTQVMLWRYDKEGRLIRQEDIRSKEGEVYGDWLLLCTYDGDGNLVREDYFDFGKPEYSRIMEYDILGNKTKKYSLYEDGMTVPENETPENEWIYEYRYVPEEKGFQHG